MQALAASLLYCSNLFRFTFSKWNRQWTADVQIGDGCSTHTHTRLRALFPGLPGWAGTRKAKPVWILLKQETVSGSGISWAMCKSAPCSRQITTPVPHSVFFTGRMPFLPPTNSVKALKAKMDAVKLKISVSMWAAVWTVLISIIELWPQNGHCLVHSWVSRHAGHTSLMSKMPSLV